MEAGIPKLDFRRTRFRFLEWLNGSGLMRTQVRSEPIFRSHGLRSFHNRNGVPSVYFSGPWRKFWKFNPKWWKNFLFWCMRLRSRSHPRPHLTGHWTGALMNSLSNIQLNNITAVRLSMSTGDWDLFLGPLEWARAEIGWADRWVL